MSAPIVLFFVLLSLQITLQLNTMLEVLKREISQLKFFYNQLKDFSGETAGAQKAKEGKII